MIKHHLKHIQMGRSFLFYIRRSSYIHVALIILTVVSGKVVIEQKKKLLEKNLQLIEASVRVDMVAMPKYTLAELKNVSSGVEDAKSSDIKPEEAKTEVKVEEKKVEEKVAEDKGPTLEEVQKKKHQDFLGKLKEISSKKVESKGDQKAEKGAGGEKSSMLKDLVLAGNKLSTGTSMYGSGSTKEMTAFQMYVAKIPDRVRPHWRLPDYLLKNKNLKCRVRVWLNISGAVTHAEIYQSSGDNDYDQRALEAVRSASPFPKLKDEYGKRATNGDIVLGFPL